MEKLLFTELTVNSMMCWHMPIIPAVPEVETGESQVQITSGLQ